jgi:dephospho-CoA kinase
MNLLGLTGGVGMGKSACAEFLRARHIPLVDTDELARTLVEPGQPSLAEIRQQFGPEALAPDGTLNRRELARRVFADPPARRQLEQILHPRIRLLWEKQVQAWRAEGRPVAVVAIPLLFETQAQNQFTATICVACSAATQRERLHSRGWSSDQIQQRNAAQFPIETKIAQSTFVIWSEGSLDIHAEQLDRILTRVGAV